MVTEDDKQAAAAVTSGSPAGAPQGESAPGGSERQGRDAVPPAEGLLRIGQLADRCGKTARALHLYEEMGLLKPAIRSRGGFRMYSPSAVERVEWISRLQEADVSLGEIQALLRDLESRHIGTEAMNRLRQLLDQKLAMCREQRQKLDRLESDLLAGLAYLDGCRTCGPEHFTTECGDCRLHGHDGSQPLMVAGVHTS
ncbi:MAG TPA: MerR family transcriptional regulator [Pseudomonadota bacterium]|nr:MerR family transcriptional regulator [Pseudomonadota bacterium]